MIFKHCGSPLVCFYERRRRSFFEYFYHSITARHLRVATIIVKVGSSNYPRAAKTATSGLIKQRRVLQPSLILRSLSCNIISFFILSLRLKKRVEDLRLNPPKVSILRLSFCYLCGLSLLPIKDDKMAQKLSRS